MKVLWRKLNNNCISHSMIKMRLPLLFQLSFLQKGEESSRKDFCKLQLQKLQKYFRQIILYGSFQIFSVIKYFENSNDLSIFIYHQPFFITCFPYFLLEFLIFM